MPLLIGLIASTTRSTGVVPGRQRHVFPVRCDDTFPVQTDYRVESDFKRRNFEFFCVWATIRRRRIGQIERMQLLVFCIFSGIAYRSRDAVGVFVCPGKMWQPDLLLFVPGLHVINFENIKLN